MLVAAASCSTVRYDELAEEYFNIGNAYYEAGDFDRSFQYYTRALAYTNELPAAGFNLARLHLERGEPEDALEVIDELLVDDPENTLYLETRAYALVLLDRPEEAGAIYRALLTGGTVRPRVSYNLALLDLEADDPTSAWEVLEAGAPFASEDSEYVWLHAEAAFSDGREEEAIGRLERFGYLVAEKPSELARLARRYAEWDFNLAALDLIDTFEPTSEDEPALAFLEGALLLEATGDFEAGVEAIEHALATGYRDREAYGELLESLPEDEAAILAELAASHGFVLEDEEGADETAPPQDFDAENAAT